MNAQPSPDAIFSTATGYMAVKYLFTAVELGLFEQLSRRSVTLEELSRDMSIAPRTLRILADALVVLGFLQKENAHYRNTPVADIYLSGHHSEDLRPFLKFWNRFSYPSWIKLEEVLRSGQITPDTTELSLEDQAIISKGIESITASTARALVTTYDFNQHHRILDIGGGTGSFLINIMRRYEHLQGTLFEQPRVARVASKHLSQLEFSGKLTISEGDIFKDPIPHGHDVVLLANVMHIFSPDHNIELLQRLRQSMNKGERLLLVDFWTNPDHTEPFFAAMLAGEFLLTSGEGDVYSHEEVDEWFGITGWRSIDHIQLEGPSSVIIAETQR